jgi:hypothetical protein
MKMYNNGQRPTKMYGGGMASPRKPMQMGGLAQQNRQQQNAMTRKTADAMGMMTDQKKFGMGYLTGGQVKLDKNKNNRIDKEDFAMLRNK